MTLFSSVFPAAATAIYTFKQPENTLEKNKNNKQVEMELFKTKQKGLPLRLELLISRILLDEVGSSWLFSSQDSDVFHLLEHFLLMLRFHPVSP